MKHRARLGPASADEIRQLAFAEVTVPETLRPGSHKPVPRGLFCEQIFGREQDWECHCGKWRGYEHAGKVCERCARPVVHLRSTRFGCIELSSPLVNPVFVRPLAHLLNYGRDAFQRLLFSQYWAVIEPGPSPFRAGDLLAYEDLQQALDAHGSTFDAETGDEHRTPFEVDTGPDAIRKLLGRLNLLNLGWHLRDRLAAVDGRHDGRSVRLRRHLICRLRVVDAICRAAPEDPDAHAARMLLDCVPVLPPAQRLLPVQGGTHATGSINDLYLELIMRESRLRKLEALSAPDVIVRNEKRMLQQVLTGLFHNASLKRPFRTLQNRLFVSLADRLAGPARRNLLHRRADYSARAVVVPDPSLRPDQCKLPFCIADELCRPLLLAWLAENADEAVALRARQLLDVLRPLPRRASEEAFRAAMRLYRELLDELGPDARDILVEVLRGKRLVLCRHGARPMHLVALEPLLAEGAAVAVHPSLGPLLGAGFSGETVTLHLPLSDEAQAEAATCLGRLRLRAARPKELPAPQRIAGPFWDETHPLNYFVAARSDRKERFDEMQRRRQTDDLRRRLVALAQRVVVTLEDCGAAQRGLLTCQAADGVCQRCYGIDRATGKRVKIGTPVGLRAALALADERACRGRLVRLEELFEATTPEQSAPLALCSGVVRVGPQHGGIRKIEVHPAGGRQVRVHFVPLGQDLHVSEGERVQRGDPLATGPVCPHELLRLGGTTAASTYLLAELNRAYFAEGVERDGRHLELIVSRMLRRVSVLHPGDTDLAPGRILERRLFQQANDGLRGLVVIEEPGDSRLPAGRLLDRESFDRECARLAEAELRLPRGREAIPARARPRLESISEASRHDFLSGLLVHEPIALLSDAALARSEEDFTGLGVNSLSRARISAGTEDSKGVNL
jgi:DNA-directed RNA polymerase beta' subunit